MAETYKGTAGGCRGPHLRKTFRSRELTEYAPQLTVLCSSRSGGAYERERRGGSASTVCERRFFVVSPRQHPEWFSFYRWDWTLRYIGWPSRTRSKSTPSRRSAPAAAFRRPAASLTGDRFISRTRSPSCR